MMKLHFYWAVTAIGLFLLSTTCRADDCDFSKGKFNTYVATCAGLDGCEYKDAMAALVVQACGKVKTDRPDLPASKALAKPLAQSTPPSSVKAMPVAKDDYSGESCSFFTKPSVESSDGVTKTNYYAENAMSCYNGKMYRCEKGRWVRLLECSSYSNWQRYLAERQETSQFEKD